MRLKSTSFIYLDCQTTGMRPPRADVLELAWAVGSAADPNIEVRSHLVRPPAGASIPPRVSEITGIRVEHLTDAIDLVDLREPLRQDFARAEAAVIHYAQFERPFLVALLGDMPRPCLCTYNITKRLFPNLPRQNIRATAGYFGPPILGQNRAGVFVRATIQIWRGLCAALEERGLNDFAAVELWLKDTKRVKPTRYEYRLDKVKRLELPLGPGVYRMLGQTGEVLYVGKATSLRDRVNSYFRGQKNRDPRKLEMVAQVWDLDVTATPTPLEAALLESDEIKRLNPPYNVVLKTGRRHIVFYDRNFTRASRVQNDEFPRGPFRNHNWIEHLRALETSVASGHFAGIFFDEIESDLIRQGFELFLDLESLAEIKTTRQFLALGVRRYRQLLSLKASGEIAEEETEITEEQAAEDDGEVELTVEEVAAKFGRLFHRAGAELTRARTLTKLLDAHVLFGERTLTFKRGKIVADVREDSATTAPWPWSDLDVDTFDRMSIVRTAVQFTGVAIKRASGGRETTLPRKDASLANSSSQIGREP